MRDVVINTAIAGATMGALLGDCDWLSFQFRLRVFSLMTGMNDSAARPAGREEFSRKLDESLERILEHDSLPLFQTPNFIYMSNAQRQRDLHAYVDIHHEFAAHNDVPLVDHYAHWSESKSTASSRMRVKYFSGSTMGAAIPTPSAMLSWQ
jgi:hypothetical protein